MTEFQTSGATCALHPGVRAVAVCDRCGGYMCEVCNDGGLQGTCPTCRARAGTSTFPLSRDAWTLDALFRIAWDGFARSAGQLIVGALITMGVAIALSMVREAFVVAAGRRTALAASLLLIGFVVQYAIQGILQLGFADMCFDAVEGQQVTLETLMWHVGKVFKLFLQYLIVLVGFGVPYALLFLGTIGVFQAVGQGDQVVVLVVAGILSLASLVPLFWFGVPLTFMQFELALDDDVGGFEAIKRCFVIARGKRWAILGMTLLAAAVSLTGLILCGIGLVASVPLGETVAAGYFLTARNGSGLPPPTRRGRRDRRRLQGIPARPVDPPMA